MSEARMPTPLAAPDESVVRPARRNRSLDRPASVAVSNGRSRNSASKRRNIDNGCSVSSIFPVPDVQKRAVAYIAESRFNAGIVAAEADCEAAGGRDSAIVQSSLRGAMKKILITGSSGLIGSEGCLYFAREGWEIHGIDNNQRAVFFGNKGDTRWNQSRLERTIKHFVHHEKDIRDRQGILGLVHEIKPDAIVHTAAQPSHDLAASIPFDDFDTNAVGTLNLLEAARQHVPESPFVSMSTNKVYGDAPNELPLTELETRWEYADEAYWNGIPESFRIDQSKHSLFGASKVASDIMVQEYGRYFGMPTCALRGGCLTGPSHSGVELHGFLSYLIKCNLTETKYNVYGYKGKQ